MKKILIAVVFLSAIVQAQTVQQCFINNVWTPCSSAPQPQFAQAPVAAKSSGSVASINAAYGSNTIKGNTLVVVYANGNNNNAASPISDTLSLTWFKAIQVANSTAFETEIWYAPNTAGGADTVTVTPGGSNASIAMTIYEVPGLVYPAAGSSPAGTQALDQTTSNTGTGATSPAVSITPILPNEYVFVGFGLGTAAQTITVASPYNNDSGQQNPTTPAGLFSFVSASLFKPEMAASSPSGSATSEPWAVAVASFKTLSVPIQGTIQGLGTAGTSAGGVVSVQGVASGTNVPVSFVANAATGSTVPASAVYIAGNGSGNSTGVITCDNSAAVNMSTSTTTQIVAISGTGGRTYICSINLVTNAANNVALVSGSGTNCASNLAGLAGGTTAATGWNFAANGGLTQGSGVGMIYKTVTTNNEICLVTSAATQLSGTITYTQF